jgi:hypothetical protein
VLSFGSFGYRKSTSISVNKDHAGTAEKDEAVPVYPRQGGSGQGGDGGAWR